MAAVKDFFATTVDEAVVDGCISAFNNMSYDITHKQRTKWKRQGKKGSQAHGDKDRFIPIRDENKFDQQQSFQDKSDKKKKEDCTASSAAPPSQGSKILCFQTTAPEAADGYISNLRTLYTASSGSESKRSLKSLKRRHIAQTAQRVLDAPDLCDDYYLNLLHWGRSNQVAIGLGPSVYLWNAEDGQISLLTEYSDDTAVTSVRWNHNAQYIAVATDQNVVTLFDAATHKALRKVRGHSSRVGALAWNHSLLSTGSADSTIRNNDVRVKQPCVAVLCGHEQEICGLTWNHDANGDVLASGGNDNKVCVWRPNEGHANHALAEFTESLSAVKALAWCPWNTNLLATGGGTGDRKIRVYDVSSLAMLTQKDAESQCCSLVWNPFEKELLSAHGFSRNQLSVWKYPHMQKTHDLTGHTARVLHTTLSPNGEIVCSAAADETLRFWKVFDSKSKNSDTDADGYALAAHDAKTSTKLNLRIR